MKNRMAFILVAVVLLRYASVDLIAQTVADTPMGQPNAVIDLVTRDGVQMVKGEWRYSDTKIIEIDFKGPGPDNQPTGAPVKTYDIVPHAGGAEFDDTQWQIIEPSTLNARRATGRVCFNWYRIKITIPEHIGGFVSTGAARGFSAGV